VVFIIQRTDKVAKLATNTNIVLDHETSLIIGKLKDASLGVLHIIGNNIEDVVGSTLETDFLSILDLTCGTPHDGACVISVAGPIISHSESLTFSTLLLVQGVDAPFHFMLNAKSGFTSKESFSTIYTFFGNWIVSPTVFDDVGRGLANEGV
jgi:hypothetical protein